MEITESMLASQDQLRYVFDKLGLSMTNEEEFEYINGIIPLLGELPKGSVEPIIIKNHQKVLDSGLEEYKMFNDQELYERAKSIVSNSGYKSCLAPANFTAYITYSVDDETSLIDKSSGKVDHFKLPVIFDKRDSIFFTHEIAHSLKETLYEEYITSLTYSDVIPILMELIASDRRSTIVKKYIYGTRLYLTNEVVDIYQKVNDFMGNNQKLRNKYAHITSQSGRYISGLYYALILFDMYKSNPIEIFNKIKEVLNKQKTTYQLLQEMGLLLQREDKVFIDILRKMKSYC